MNRAFLIVGIPAVLTSFGWLAFVWGWRFAATVTAMEIVAITVFVVYVLRRQGQKNRATQPRVAAKVEPRPANSER
jgi:membrane protein implicated in regulation of membrane protease activity